MKSLIVGLGDLGEEAEAARKLILSCGLPGQFAAIDSGRYGFTRIGLDALDVIERVLATITEVRGRLALIIGQAGRDGGFLPPRELTGDESLFATLVAVYAGCVEGAETTAGLSTAAVRVENTFDLGQVQNLLDGPPVDLGRRLLGDLAGWVQHHQRSRRLDDAQALAGCLAAYFRLMSQTVRELARDARFEYLRQALERTEMEVLGRRFEGFSWQPALAETAASGLLPVTVDEIVGNQEYLQACLRTARDVAGFDLAAGENPKTINPVLFALGRPGCGKTVTAHAVGNYFLDYCRERGVAARFLCIRRTDWASSYQNVSANNLVRIFGEQVAAFHGVVGVYWPDIDTAFAARDDSRVRAEEKSILGACFGVFDGTLLPKNGKWFMMADANTMNMDQATVSRITQDPFLLAGAKTPAEVVRLLAEVKLGRHRRFVPLTEQEWLDIAERCLELGLSGRAVDNISRRIIGQIEDFEYPDEYFSATLERRRQIIAERSRSVSAEDVARIAEQYGAFERASEEQAARERFDRRVEEIVLNLSAERAALERARTILGGESSP